MPNFDFIDMEYTEKVQAIKSTFYVVFNRLRGRFVVMDRDNNNSPYIVMVVQEPDGKFRSFDERTLAALRKSLRMSAGDILRELDLSEHQRMVKLEKDLQEIQYGMMHDFKWAGRDVVPSTTMRDRSIHRVRPQRQDSGMREAIRGEIGS